MINISLAYALNESKQDYQELQIANNSTIYQALQMVGWLDKYPELATWCEQINNSKQSLATKPNARLWRVGIYSQKKPLNHILQANDRIEIYHPLRFEPMSRRKKRAKW